MQTKPTLDLSAVVVRQSTDAEPAQARPIELDLTVLQCVAGGGSPRGGWTATATVTDTTDAPRGGW
jgi:hypothetical protein